VIVDLHNHYPMHLVPDGKLSVWRLLRSRRERLRFRDRIRALLVGLASLFINYRSPFSGPRIRIEYMQKGGVNVGLSVLFSFFDEVDVLDGPRPKASYTDSILDQLDFVADHVREKHAGQAFVATNPQALEARGEGEVALVHCVEGGYHLGGTPQEVTEAVERFASRGVAYIILAHLIWRGVATDAHAIPFLSEETYNEWFPQPEEGLSDLGRAAVEAMVRERVLIDLSHMSERSIEDTLDLLDELDPKAPVYATHAGYRFGKQEYMLSETSIKRIAAREGVIGLILARYQLEDGPPPETPGHRRRLSKEKRFEDSFETIRAHLDKIHEITGSHRFTAIGSDFDGFIKPTLAGLEDMRDMARLEAALKDHYGDEDAALICSENALRPLRTYWRGSPS
jgi:microsomal dipeptidase-like Zn-dependent dipeptidase